MYGVWGKGCDEKNTTLAFRIDLQKKCDFTLRISAATCYKLIVDGQQRFFGPERTAHGWISVKDLRLTGRIVVAEVTYFGVPSYAYVHRAPFFYAEIKTAQSSYTTEDFVCYKMCDRVQKVPRYSYQRGFCEIYDLACDRTALYKGQTCGKACEVERVKLPPCCPKELSDPRLTLHLPQGVAEQGSVATDATLSVWRSNMHTLVGEKLDGFAEKEWQACSTDDASKFVYTPDGTDGEYAYVTLDMGRAITGFLELTVQAGAAGKVYVLFDEILWHETGKGENYVGFSRNNCSSAFLWNLRQAGRYSLSTAEPYTARYVCLVYSPDVQVQFAIRDWENPDALLRIECDDEAVNEIVRAAEATFAQNAVDILTDCPSRERAGWLSDSYFSSVAELYFTGDNKVERSFLDNFTYGAPKTLPQGMVPMVYPADDYDGVFIPNWAMWYILELEKYMRLHGADDTVQRAQSNVEGIVRYFTAFENELGLLENLESWVFVEWSAANRADHVCGVNIPTNMCYAATLAAAAKLLGRPQLHKKATRIRAAINKHAQIGTLFVDNLVRNNKNELVSGGLYTEVCQYYAFWFDCATKETHGDLYKCVIENFGPHRAPDFMREVAPPNAMYGIYMRLDLLLRDGNRQAVLDECKAYFSGMAKRTGTLWENNNIDASCNHGFASYCIRWIVFALTGYDLLTDTVTGKSIGLPCSVTLPTASGDPIALNEHGRQ